MRQPIRDRLTNLARPRLEGGVGRGGSAVAGGRGLGAPPLLDLQRDVRLAARAAAAARPTAASSGAARRRLWD
eukprot:1883124-Prymnesium_polylepis.1